MRPSLTLLMVLTLLPAATAANLESVELEPRAAPAEMELVILGTTRPVDVPASPAKATVPARLPHARAPMQDVRVEDQDATTGGAHARTEEGDVASPETMRASLAVGALERAGIPLGDVGLRVRGEGGALVPIQDAPLQRDELSSRGFEALGSDPSGPFHAASRGALVPLAIAPGEPSPPETAPSLPRGAPPPPSRVTDAAVAAAAATGAWGRVVALAAGALILLLAPFALYHRLRGARTLENATRAKLAQLLRERPGLMAAEAARELGVDRTTARYHLARLASEGLAVTQGPGTRPRYFAPGSARPDERAALVVANDSARVLDAIRHAPGLSQVEYARGLGIGRSTLRWHLRRLEGARLVRLEREGRAVKVRLGGAAAPSS